MMNESSNASTQEMNVTEKKQLMKEGLSYVFPLTSISIALCILGLMGNGYICWFLFVKIRRTQFTVYILNLAVADSIFLSGFVTLLIYIFCCLNGLKPSVTVETYIVPFVSLMYNFGFNAGIYLLMAINLERCFAVLYPFQYQCQRPKNISVYACIIFWMLSILVTALETFVCSSGKEYLKPGSGSCTNVYFFTSTLYLIAVTTMLVSSFMLLIEVQKASKHCHPPKLYVAICASVAVFLISVVPARILGLLLYFKILQSNTFLVAFFYVTAMCSAFNCSANPYIYIIVGRWGAQTSKRSSLKQLLERVFKEVTESESTSGK